MPEQFEKGEVVKLKSGGPKMTVQGTKAYSSSLICKWFEGTDAKTDAFAPESLEKVEE